MDQLRAEELGVLPYEVSRSTGQNGFQLKMIASLQLQFQRSLTSWEIEKKIWNKIGEIQRNNSFP